VIEMTEKASTVAVIGGGAMGGLAAARLSANGIRTLVVDISPELVSAIESEGIHVDGPDGTIEARPEVTTNPIGREPVDIVLVFVKGHHTAGAAATAAPLIGENTIVATLQNGWGNADVLAESVPPERLVIGVTYNSATIDGPARVRHTSSGATFIGPYRVDAGIAAADSVGGVLRAAGFEVTVTERIMEEIWRKLVLNAATLPTAALTGLQAGELAQPGIVLDLVDRLAAEAVAVARAQGLDIDLGERLARIHAILEKGGSGKPSMLQDVEGRRKTEIERINGAIVRAGETAGIDVPLNRAMVALVNGLERSWAR
jgi:2-dehydropantoate 2-reductase